MVQGFRKFMNLKFSILKKYYNTDKNGDYAFFRAFFFLDLLFYTGCFNLIYMFFISEVRTISYLSLLSAIIAQVVYFIFPNYEYLSFVESMKKMRFYLYLLLFILLPVFSLAFSYLVLHLIK